MRDRLIVQAAVLLGLWPVLVFLGRGFSSNPEEARASLPLALIMAVAWLGRHDVGRPAAAFGLKTLAILLAAYACSWPLLPMTATASLGLVALWWAGPGRAMPRGGRMATFLLLFFALPIAPELDFYAGFPLRLIATRIAAFLLWPLTGAMETLGTTIVVAGRAIEVDAPCSGLRMLWVGLVAVLGNAALRRFGPGRTCAMLAIGLLLILLANAFRSAVLALAEARGQGLSDLGHAVFGLFVFGGTTLIILMVGAGWRRA